MSVQRLPLPHLSVHLFYHCHLWNGQWQSQGTLAFLVGLVSVSLKFFQTVSCQICASLILLFLHGNLPPSSLRCPAHLHASVPVCAHLLVHSKAGIVDITIAAAAAPAAAAL